MKSSTGMFEITIFLCLMSVCLTVSFTSLHCTERDVVNMHYKSDTRQIHEVNSGGMLYGYMSRPGAYLDATRLTFSAGTASADTRAKIRVFDTLIDSYDMYMLNVSQAYNIIPEIYERIEAWWAGFSASPQYTCSYGVTCTGANTCPNAQLNTYIFSSNTSVRTFDPTHITASLAGFEMRNPTTLSECKFKMRVVEVGKDPVDGAALLEYRIFIFLGSLVKQAPGSSPQVEYRWYECVMGGAGQPWVVLE